MVWIQRTRTIGPLLIDERREQRDKEGFTNLFMGV